MNPSINVSVDLTGLLAELQRDLDATLADMMQVPRATDENTYTPSHRIGVMDVVVSNADGYAATVPGRATRACFLACIGKFVGYMDKLIASQPSHSISENGRATAATARRHSPDRRRLTQSIDHTFTASPRATPNRPLRCLRMTDVEETKKWSMILTRRPRPLGFLSGGRPIFLRLLMIQSALIFPPKPAGGANLNWWKNFAGYIQGRIIPTTSAFFVSVLFVDGI